MSRAVVMVARRGWCSCAGARALADRQAGRRGERIGTRRESQGATGGGRGMLQLLAMGRNDVSEAWLEVRTWRGHGTGLGGMGSRTDRRGRACCRDDQR